MILRLRVRKFGARLGQGWGKVGARSGQKARFGQGLGRQGLSKVRARLGQGRFSCDPNLILCFPCFYLVYLPFKISRRARFIHFSIISVIG